MHPPPLRIESIPGYTPTIGRLVAWSVALKLGDEGRRALRNRSLDHYLDELRSVRRVTLERLAARDDAWLERSVSPAPKINVHWAWFHVAEDEINHRGQIRRLPARLPERLVGEHVV